MSFSLELGELINIDGIPKDNLTFKINVEDLDIDLDDELGSGSFASVYRGYYLWTEVAIKKMIIPEDDNGLVKYFKREVVLLKYVEYNSYISYIHLLLLIIKIINKTCIWIIVLLIIYFVFIDSIVYTFDYILHNIIAIEVLMFMQYSLLKHPNIVQFLGWCHPEDTDYILLVEGTLFLSISLDIINYYCFIIYNCPALVYDI